MANTTKTYCNDLQQILASAGRENQRIDIGIGVGVALFFLILLVLLTLWRHFSRSRSASVVGIPISTTTFIFLYLFLIVFPSLLLRRRLHDRAIRANDGNRVADFKNLCTPPIHAFQKECADPCADLIRKLQRGYVFNLSTVAVGLVFLFVGAAFFTVFFRRVGERQLELDVRDSNDAARAVARPTRPAGAAAEFKLKIVEKTDAPSADAAEGAEEDTVCAICITELWERPVAELPCSHRFHSACAHDWLRKAPVPLCPLCKAEVEPADGEG